MRKFLFGLAALTAVTTGLAFPANVGPKADVAAVLAAEHQLSPNENMGPVHVVGDYALLVWAGKIEGTGTHAYKRIAGERWTRIGVFAETLTTVNNLVRSGIPESVAKQLCLGWGGSPQFPNGNSPCMN